MTKEIHDINTRALDFVVELIEYIFEYPDDDYMTMECLCRKLHKHELIAKVNGHWQPLDKRCEDCIFVEGSHWCNGCDKTPKGMKEYDEYYAKADRKTENCSEIPNNCECEPRKEQNFCGKCRYLYRDFKYGLSCYRLMDNEPCKYEERKDEATISKMEQVDKDINVRSKDEPRTGEMMTEEEFDSMLARVLIGNNEPQTATEIAKAIVHKMIDDAVLAEDAYPYLRQKMHDAVDEYEPQTDCAWK